MTTNAMRTREFLSTLRYVPQAEGYEQKIEKRIEQVAGFLADNLNHQLGMFCYYNENAISLRIKWKYIDKTTWQHSSILAERVDLNLMWVFSAYERYVLINEYLAMLERLVEKYRGKKNPIKLLNKLLANNDDFVVVSAKADIKKYLPKNRAIVLPVGMSVERAFAYVLKNFRKPEKKIAVYNYLRKKINKSHIELLAGQIFKEKESKVKKYLAEMMEALSEQGKPRMNRRI